MGKGDRTAMEEVKKYRILWVVEGADPYRKSVDF